MLRQAPLPDIVKGLAKAVAEAQLDIDRVVVEQMQLLSSNNREHGIDLYNDGNRHSMLELGFTPTFYHFSEVNISARVAFSTMESQSITVGASIGGSIGLFSASVNAEYSNKYSFNAEGSSEVNTKIIAVPPPAPMLDLISDMTDRLKAKKGS